MERKIARNSELGAMESFVHKFIMEWRNENGGPPGNRTIASAFNISRKEAGRIRSSVRVKLSLPPGF